MTDLIFNIIEIITLGEITNLTTIGNKELVIILMSMFIWFQVFKIVYDFSIKIWK
jgi:hypothetical protein